MKTKRTFPKGFIVCVSLLSLFLIPTSSLGATFCVSNATELQSALTTAASNGADDTSQTVTGPTGSNSGIRSDSIITSNTILIRLSIYRDGRFDSYHILEYNSLGQQTRNSDYDELGNLEGYYISEYNSSGLMTKGSMYSWLGNLEWYRIWEYNSSDQKTREAFYDGLGNLGHYEIWEYNTSGQLTKWAYHHYYSWYTISGYHTYEYNSLGQQTKRSAYDELGNLEWYEIWQYNSLGQQTTYSSYDGFGNLERYIVWQYNSLGQIITMSGYDELGNLKGYAILEYNSLGQIITLSSYDELGNLEWYSIYEYNSSGQKTKEAYYDGFDNLDRYFIWEYNSDNQLTKRVEYYSQSNSKWANVYQYSNRLGPIAQFSLNSIDGLAPLNVNFRDSSIGTITSWLWDFGDGQTSTEQNPTHTYNDLGTYTVSLTVTGPTGSNTDIRSDYIRVTCLPPESYFAAIPTHGAVPLTVNFTDLSTGTITERLWEFGDGHTSTEENPDHIYRIPGTFSV